jgi:HlyD family secretion protein
MPDTKGSTVHPTQSSITEEVDTIGTIKAANNVDLAFQRSGRISYISANVGSHVAAGTTLAAIDSADLQASLEQAQAALQVQQAKLDALKIGARSEDVAVAKSAVSGAQTAVLQGKQSVLAAARNAYAVSDDAIHNKVDQFINNPRSASPSLAFNISNTQLQASVISDRVKMEGVLSDWQTYVNALPFDASSIDAASVSSKTDAYLLQVGTYLDEVAAALNQVVYTTAYTSTVVQGYQASITAGRSSNSAALTAQNSAETGEQAAESSLASAQSNLGLKQAPATTQDLEQQQAQVSAAQANVDAVQATLAQTSIRAPFSGTVTVNNAHLGAIAAPSSPLISMISDARYQFETYVSQADLAKVKVGDKAEVTLDAYQADAPLPAHVIAVDPAATVNSGISSYKVTLQFDAPDAREQAGLTGNARIITEMKENALQVPSSAIVKQGTGTFVLKITGSASQLVPVVIGVTNPGGMTEIISGISTADSIRSFGTQQ